jgi:hypothetical protein
VKLTVKSGDFCAFVIVVDVLVAKTIVEGSTCLMCIMTFYVYKQTEYRYCYGSTYIDYPIDYRIVYSGLSAVYIKQLFKIFRCMILFDVPHHPIPRYDFLDLGLHADVEFQLCQNFVLSV